MKFNFRPSPNYRRELTTDSIMADLTAALLAVAAYAIVTYWANYGMSYGIRIIIMLVVAVACALATEAIYYKATKKDVKKELLHSYGWVTAIIIVLITKINVSYYAVGVSTILAILFGKLVFGGFGQNIFNPAAFGEALIMNSFASSTAADFTTGATPMTTMNAAGWVMTNSAFEEFIGDFGGLANMVIGNYPAVIGGSAAIVIVAGYIFLALRKDIDWRTSAIYLGTVFVISLIVGLIHGEGLWFPVFNLLAGGTLFCGVFMLTDPVTNPVTIPGRIIFAVGAAALTLIIRWKSNLPDGALYSILLMNMLVPAIDKAIDGNQIKGAKNIQKKVCIITAICALIALGIGATLTSADAEETTPSAPIATSETGPASSKEESGSGFAMSDDYSDTNVTCEEESNDGTTAVYNCSAKGLEGVQEATVTVDLESQSITSIEITAFNDTEGLGDLATTDEALAAYEGATLDSTVDGVSGATYTSKSVAAMASAALNAAAE